MLSIRLRSFRPQRGHSESFNPKLLMIHLSLLKRTGPYRGDTFVMDAFCEPPGSLWGHVGQNHHKTRCGVFEGVVVVVQDNHAPVGVMLCGCVGSGFSNGCWRWHGGWSRVYVSRERSLLFYHFFKPFKIFFYKTYKFFGELRVAFDNIFEIL